MSDCKARLDLAMVRRRRTSPDLIRENTSQHQVFVARLELQCEVLQEDAAGRRAVLREYSFIHNALCFGIPNVVYRCANTILVSRGETEMKRWMKEKSLC